MSDDRNIVYFAYGANLSRNHMFLWCPHATPLGRATLTGYRLVFRFWCDVMAAPGRTVPGCLYRLGDGDLQWLDEYEDCPRLYERITVTVTTESGERVEAMTYKMKAGQAFAPPNQDYLAIVHVGYRDWGYDVSALPPLASS